MEVGAVSETRDTYKYHFKVGGGVVHRGVTTDLQHTETDLRRTWPNGHIRQVGRRTTAREALRWERLGGRRSYTRWPTQPNAP